MHTSAQRHATRSLNRLRGSGKYFRSSCCRVGRDCRSPPSDTVPGWPRLTRRLSRLVRVHSRVHWWPIGSLSLWHFPSIIHNLVEVTDSHAALLSFLVSKLDIIRSASLGLFRSADNFLTLLAKNYDSLASGQNTRSSSTVSLGGSELGISMSTPVKENQDLHYIILPLILLWIIYSVDSVLRHGLWLIQKWVHLH